MKIILSGKNIKLDSPLKVFVDQKIGGLEKFVKSGIKEAKVEIGLPSRHHRSGRIYYAEVNLRVNGKLFRATCQHEDLRNAIVDVKKELEQQIKKFKEKKLDTQKKPK